MGKANPLILTGSAICTLGLAILCAVYAGWV